MQMRVATRSVNFTCMYNYTHLTSTCPLPYMSMNATRRLHAFYGRVGAAIPLTGTVAGHAVHSTQRKLIQDGCVSYVAGYVVRGESKFKMAVYPWIIEETVPTIPGYNFEFVHTSGIGRCCSIHR